MGNYHTIEFTELNIGSITLNSYGGVYGVGSSRYAARGLNSGKMAAYSELSSGYTPKQYILNTCYHFTPRQGDSIYISKNCKTNRDLYRNSGYKIVLDPEKAKFTIIPDLANNLPEFYYDILVYDYNKKSIYLFTIHKNGYSGIDIKDISEDDERCILAHFNARNLEVISNGIQLNSKLYVLHECDEYNDILYSAHSGRVYVRESTVNFTLPVDISVETLQLWGKSKDYDMLTQSICNSNWREYPFTLCMFMSAYHSFLPYYGNASFKNVLDQIGYEKGCRIADMFSGRDINPKDWNLAQSFIMAQLGVSENGGYANLQNIPSEIADIIRRRFVVAPLKINAPIRIANAVSLIKA